MSYSSLLLLQIASKLALGGGYLQQNSVIMPHDYNSGSRNGRSQQPYRRRNDESSRSQEERRRTSPYQKESRHRYNETGQRTANDLRQNSRYSKNDEYRHSSFYSSDSSRDKPHNAGRNSSGKSELHLKGRNAPDHRVSAENLGRNSTQSSYNDRNKSDNLHQCLPQKQSNMPKNPQSQRRITVLPRDTCKTEGGLNKLRDDNIISVHSGLVKNIQKGNTVFYLSPQKNTSNNSGSQNNKANLTFNRYTSSKTKDPESSNNPAKPNLVPKVEVSVSNLGSNNTTSLKNSFSKFLANHVQSSESCGSANLNQNNTTNPTFKGSESFSTSAKANQNHINSNQNNTTNPTFKGSESLSTSAKANQNHINSNQNNITNPTFKGSELYSTPAKININHTNPTFKGSESVNTPAKLNQNNVNPAFKGSESGSTPVKLNQNIMNPSFKGSESVNTPAKLNQNNKNPAFNGSESCTTPAKPNQNNTLNLTFRNSQSCSALAKPYEDNKITRTDSPEVEFISETFYQKTDVPSGPKFESQPNQTQSYNNFSNPTVSPLHNTNYVQSTQGNHHGKIIVTNQTRVEHLQSQSCTVGVQSNPVRSRLCPVRPTLINPIVKERTPMIVRENFKKSISLARKPAMPKKPIQINNKLLKQKKKRAKKTNTASRVHNNVANTNFGIQDVSVKTEPVEEQGMEISDQQNKSALCSPGGFMDLKAHNTLQSSLGAAVKEMWCQECKVWMDPKEIRCCLCKFLCEFCSLKTPGCLNCGKIMMADDRLSSFCERLWKVIPHPCYYSRYGCQSVINPDDVAHETTCDYKPITCYGCGLEVPLKLMSNHLQNHHPNSKMMSSTNSNVVSTHFMDYYSPSGQTKESSIFCSTPKQSIWISVTSADVNNPASQIRFRLDPVFVAEKAFVKFLFKFRSYTYTEICTLDQSKSQHLEIDRNTFEDWYKGESTLDITIRSFGKRSKSE